METKTQKLEKRNTYTPIDASQVRSSVTMSLNKEETLSEHSLKTSSNVLDVNQHSGKNVQNLRVFVLNMHNKPLMPCSPAKARHLIEQGKAKVVSRKPFTIKLTCGTGETKQKINLGIDAGFKYVGFSATTEKEELISGEFELRNNVSNLLTERKMYRRMKRNKLQYRQARFLNRVKSKHKGWLAPSVKHKLDSHISLINKIKSILPITNTIVEVAKFDTQKLANPEIQGIEYQTGVTSNYDNVRAYVFARDKYTCQICKKQFGILQTHHIIQRKDQGSDKPDNLITLHATCHEKFHNGKIKHNFTKPKTYKETTVMNNLFKKVVDKLNCEYTYGYITNKIRTNLGLDKTHYNDAFVISGGTNQKRCGVKYSKQIRRNNRKLQQNRKGQQIAIRKKRYEIQSGDVVRCNNKILISNGVFNFGKYVSFVNNESGIKYGKMNDVEVIHYGKGIQC